VARPNWEYVRVDVRLPRHRKLDGLTRPVRSSVIGTLAELWGHCGEELTDGFVRDVVWNRTGTAAARKIITARGFADRGDGGWWMHDYLDYNRSRAEVLAMLARRSEAGKRSAARRQQRVEQGVEHRVEQGVQQTLNTTLKYAEAEAEAEADLVVADVSDRPDRSKPPGDPVTDLIMTEIRAVTGRAITADWAERVGRHILDGRSPADPAAYLRQAIRSEPDPAKRFLPLY
jgi:hypothetical protein